jgi:hypothetical protein
MIKQRTMILSVAVAALSLGLAGSVAFGAEDTSTTGSTSPTTGATSPATGAEESPTTGKEEGTHTGTGQGVTPEHDTAKIVQPPRASPTTSGETPTEQPTTGDQTGQ